jgi:hypothetical protein
MVELVVAVIALFNVGIFLAHAIDAYSAESAAPKAPGPHGARRDA